MTEIINQIFAMDVKMKKDDYSKVQRQMDRIYHELSEMGYQIVNPIGQRYRNEMTDLEANISDEITDDSKITKVLKPVIYGLENNESILLQKGLVIVE